MTDHLNIGDTVTLKSGGPCMTVEGFFDVADEHGLQVRHCTCIWFEDTYLRRGGFAVAALKEAP